MSILKGILSAFSKESSNEVVNLLNNLNQKDKLLIKEFKKNLTDLKSLLHDLNIIREELTSERLHTSGSLEARNKVISLMKEAFQEIRQVLTNKIYAELTQEESIIKKILLLVDNLNKYISNIMSNSSILAESHKYFPEKDILKELNALREELTQISKQISNYHNQLNKFTLIIIKFYDEYSNACDKYKTSDDIEKKLMPLLNNIEKPIIDEINTTNEYLNKLNIIDEQYALLLNIESELKKLNDLGLMDKDSPQYKLAILKNNLDLKKLFQEIASKMENETENSNVSYTRGSGSLILGDFSVKQSYVLSSSWSSPVSPYNHIIISKGGTELLLLNMNTQNGQVNIRGDIDIWLVEFIALLKEHAKSK